jgi:hypothetical protein
VRVKALFGSGAYRILLGLSQQQSLLHTDETNGFDDDWSSDCAILDLDGFSTSRLGTGRNREAVLVSSNLNLSVAAEMVSKPQFQHRPAIGFQFSSAFRLLGQ